MPIRSRLAVLALAVLVSTTPNFAGTAFARTVTDQLDRRVTVPDEVRRVVALQHQSLDIVVELGAADRLVGVLRSWRSQIPGLERMAPGLVSLPTPGDLTTVNIEALLALHPDVVFVTNYAPPAMLRQMEDAGLPVVAVSLSHGEGIEAAKLNPTLADDDTAYAQGLQEGVRLIGGILGQDARAEALLDAAFEGRRLVEQRVGPIPAADRVRLYMANPQLNSYGSGKYTGVIMQRSGGINVAREVRGAVRVSMEDVLRWDPQVIFVQDRYAAVADEIRAGAAWQPIAAVQAGRILVTPEYVKPWGYPLPEALALGELWMARALYPDRFADIDMQARVDAFYRRFYGVPGPAQ
ncbi:MAG: ABC transporter substrate-binding protein [Janthinobacterium lividum]